MICNSLSWPPSHRSSSPDAGRRLRLTASIAIYASAVGASAILIANIAQTGPYDEAGHLTLIPSIYSALTGAAAAVLVTPLAIYHVRHHATEQGGLPTWLALGFGFGLASTFVSGALVPLTAVLISFTEGLIGLGELPSLAFEATLRGIRSFYIEGALALYTWLIAGAVFGIGGWAIDRSNASPSLIASKYGTWTLSLVLGSTIVAFAAFGPPELLRQLG